MRMDELARTGDRGGARRARALPPGALGGASTSTGWRTSGRGASRASCGGDTGCRSSTATARRRYVGTRARPSGDGLGRQDDDVLDTWFSSALWPFATLGWPEQTPELRAFYPTDVLVTARDIIFLWVARMVMMGARVHRRGAVRRRLRPRRSSRRPTAGGCRSRSAPASTRSSRSRGAAAAGLRARRELPRLRRRRAALRAARDVLDPGRELHRGQDRPGPQLATSCGTPRG